MRNAITDHALPLRQAKDLYPLIERLSQAKIVMLGEASHGTQEFYEWRRLISQELIARHGFHFIAAEADWPPSAQLNRFLHGKDENGNAQSSLHHFQRWPTWMWANTEMVRMTQWLRDYNRNQSSENQSGFFGLDVYSLFESIDEVLRHLRNVDPVLARKAQTQYDCFGAFQRNEKAYVRHLKSMPEGCQEEVMQVMKDLLLKRLGVIQASEDEQLFDAEQNARIVKNAEYYYRAMIYGNEDSWNVRDRHMIETLEVILRRYGPEAKAIVWAHNTHIGDYRATTMVKEGLVNIGGLAREKWGDDRVALVGFGTYEGEVIASHSWEGPTEVMTVPQAQRNSYEAEFHEACERLGENNILFWMKNEAYAEKFTQMLGHRAIGVVYNPAYERFGNYVPTSLAKRYDGFIFIDQSTPLVPLKQTASRKEIPETWPRGV